MIPEYYTPEQIAKEKGFTRDTVWRWVRESKVQSEKIGRSVIIYKTPENETFIKNRMEEKKINESKKK